MGIVINQTAKNEHVAEVSAYKSRDYYVTYILVDNQSAISAAEDS